MFSKIIDMFYLEKYLNIVVKHTAFFLFKRFKDFSIN